MTEYKQHPLSAAFPAMSGLDLQNLADDLMVNGQRESGVIFENMVLDGWHRYLGCVQAGIPFKASEFDGADPVSFVLSRNLHRRHLTASQRGASIVACKSWKPSGRPGKAAAAAGFSNKAMAKEAEVSERTIANAKVAHKAGLGEAVKEGKVSAERAAEVAKLPKKERAKALQEKPAPKPRVIAANPKVEAEYEAVKAALAEEKEASANLADTARELEDRLTAFEKTEPDEQQKEIMRLQKRVVKLEAEVARLNVLKNDCQNKNNELIREVKRLQRRLGVAQ